MYRIIVAGGRDFEDYDLLEEKVTEIIDELGAEEFEIVSGGARGADKLGETYANQRDLPWRRFPAEWDKYGKGAGHVRNAQMGNYATEDGYTGVLIAFWDGNSTGTSNMISIAKRLKMKIYIINY